MTAEALKLKFNLKPINVMAKEQLKPEFLKINPQHTIPTLVDNDFSIWESRAICVYLVEKYGKNDSLYPKDAKVRAVINQRLYFDMGTLSTPFYDYYFASFMGKEPNPETFKKLEASVEFLEKFLEATGFAAGTTKLTIADLVLFSTVSTIESFDFDLAPYPQVKKWLELMKETAPGRDQNQEGIELMTQMFKK